MNEALNNCFYIVFCKAYCTTQHVALSILNGEYFSGPSNNTNAELAIR